MPISHEHQVIFVHVPKAAGTSIEFALGMHGRAKSIGVKRQRLQTKNFHRLFGKGLQHLTLNEIRDLLQSRHFKSYRYSGWIKQAIDRVLDSIGSPAAAQVRAHNKELFDRYHKFAVVRNPYDRFLSHFFWKTSMWTEETPSREDFRSFVARIDADGLHAHDVDNSGHLTPQTEFLTVDGVIGADSILHFENLDEEFRQLSERLGVQVQLPHRMKSAGKRLDDFYTDDEYRIIGRLYAADFRAFGYAQQM